jgi:hypothetical protein
MLDKRKYRSALDAAAGAAVAGEVGEVAGLAVLRGADVSDIDTLFNRVLRSSAASSFLCNCCWGGCEIRCVIVRNKYTDVSISRTESTHRKAFLAHHCIKHGMQEMMENFVSVKYGSYV